MSAFDELERQLSESVAARARLSRAAAVVGLGRWWRGRVGRGGGLLVAMPVLFFAIVGAALMVRPAPAPLEARFAIEPALSASTGARTCRPCRTVGDQLHAPMSGEGQAGGVVAVGTPQVNVRRGRPIVSWAQPELPEVKNAVG